MLYVIQMSTALTEGTWRLARSVIRLVPGPVGQRRLARRAVARLEPPATTLRVRAGKAWALDLDVRDRLQAEFFLTGVWEPWLQQFIVDHLPPGGTFFDVGANVGLASLSIATRTRGTVQIHAFEPSPENVRAFRHNLSLNSEEAGSVRLSEAAVGSTANELALRFGAESGHHHMVKDARADDVIVPVLSLCDYARDQSIDSIDCMKIDVEGWELEVLRGADELINSHAIRALVCEVEESHLRRAGTSAHEVVRFMLERGYVPVPLRKFSERVRGALAASPMPTKLTGDVVFLPVEDVTER
jgi:FkbM family methyltransferase